MWAQNTKPKRKIWRPNTYPKNGKLNYTTIYSARFN